MQDAPFRTAMLGPWKLAALFSPKQEAGRGASPLKKQNMRWGRHFRCRLWDPYSDGQLMPSHLGETHLSTYPAHRHRASADLFPVSCCSIGTWSRSSPDTPGKLGK